MGKSSEARKRIDLRELDGMVESVSGYCQVSGQRDKNRIDPMEEMPKMFRRKTQAQTHLPSFPANQTLAKGRHRLVCTSRLCLAVADLPLPALATDQTRADALFRLRGFRSPHILPFNITILFSPLRALELIVRHDDEALRRNLAGDDLHTQRWIGLILEILVKRAHFGFVDFFVFGAVFYVSGCFDGGGDGENSRGGLGGEVDEAIIDKADAVVAGRLAGTVDIYFVFFPTALVGWDGGCRGGFGGSGRGGGRSSAVRRGAGGFLAVWSRTFLLADVVAPLANNFSR